MSSFPCSAISLNRWGEEESRTSVTALGRPHIQGLSLKIAQRAVPAKARKWQGYAGLRGSARTNIPLRGRGVGMVSRERS